MTEIILTFSFKTGEAKVDAQGFHGAVCQDATQFLRDALGEMKDFQKKEEWYEENLATGEISSNLCG